MVTVKSFGSCPDGEVSLITMTDSTGLSVELLTLGASVRSITLPDRQGQPTDVCLGYDSPDDYLREAAYVGATIGRCASRNRGACLTINGETFPLTANEGKNHLHGGTPGFDKRLWKHSVDGNRVTFHLVSPHLEEGYPGEVFVKVTYSLVTPGQLDIDYFAVTDQDTVVSLTNHCYFNLSGHHSGRIDDHVLTLDSQFYLPLDSENLPTGEVRLVEDTVLDLRQPVRLGDRLDDAMLAHTRGFDHNYLVDPLSEAPLATAYSPKTGIQLEVRGDRHGLQLYTAGFFGQQTGKGGVAYDNAQGFALESQQMPDAIHHPHFHSPILRVDDTYTQHISYRFSVKD